MAFGDGLSFRPLYWVYHDQWHFRTWRLDHIGNWGYETYKHRGHIHFFMMGHDFALDGGKAYQGQQLYEFSLEDLWSSRLTTDDDPNLHENTRIIGNPKWYFWIREYWRRVYIQRWDSSINADDDTITGKIGLKYDASLPIHTYGPFREGRGNFFHWVKMARTLPIEYFHDEEKQSRDHWLRLDPQASWNQKWGWNAEGFEQIADTNIDPSGFTPTKWVIPRTIYAGRPSNHAEYPDGPSEDNPARRFAYADSEYIYPTIEYQSFQHLEWERHPDFADQEDGDAFNINISIPFKINGVIQSPFSNDVGEVGAPGTYYHNFDSKHPERTQKYAATNKTAEFPSNIPEDELILDGSEWIIPSGLLGTTMPFNVPSHMNEDGIWVEQCLGAIVHAKALVTIEDNFGKQYEVWVTGYQFNVQDNFEGKDQNEPAE
jgi:hypothetical protein